MTASDRIQTGLLFGALVAIGLGITTMIYDKRAWVLLDSSIKPRGLQDRPGFIAHDGKIKNFGVGPAFKTCIVMDNFAEVPEAFPFGKCEQGGMVVGGGEDFSIDIYVPTSFPTNHQPCVIGLITYRDQFGFHRGTRFCIVERLKDETKVEKGADKAEFSSTLSPCVRFNDAW